MITMSIKQPSLFGDVDSGAVISSNGVFRFQLWRIWDKSLPLVLWIMHNPSTADADQDDPTIRRVRQFTKDWGYGGFYVGNLSPYRATDPTELKNLFLTEILPFENLTHIESMKSKCSLVVLAHGNPSRETLEYAIKSCPEYTALKLTKAGNPGHPLYLKSDLKPQPITTL